MKKFKDVRKLQEAPLVVNQIGAVKSISTRIETQLSSVKMNPKRRVQMLAQLGKIIGVKVKELPNGKIEMR